MHDPFLALFAEILSFILTGARDFPDRFQTSLHQKVPRWVLRVVLAILLILAMIALLVGSIFLVLWIFGGV